MPPSPPSVFTVNRTLRSVSRQAIGGRRDVTDDQLFCSGEHAQAWEQARQTQSTTVLTVLVGVVLTLREAVDLGRELWGKLQDERII
jgi:hypothetical protein